MSRTDPLKIHADRAYLPDGCAHIPLLYPFWGVAEEDPREPTAGRFDKYIRSAAQTFSLTSLEDCDVALLPVNWDEVRRDAERKRLARSLFSRAGRLGKRIVVFFVSDSDEDIEEDGLIVFRTSMYRSRRRPNEFAAPGWSEDLVERYGNGTLSIRGKDPEPTVGFCGFAPRRKSVLKRGLRAAAGRLTGRTPWDATIRGKALRILEQADGIRTNFTVRSEFLGGSYGHPVDERYRRLHETRREFVDNLRESDYALVARGNGNFSYRLYEALSFGRIPLFIDTDCVLPLEHLIDWKNLGVWVDASRLRKAPGMLREWHHALSETEFAERQRICRRTWERYLAPEPFFRHLRSCVERAG